MTDIRKGSLDEKIVTTFTRREVMLLKLCIEVMARSHTRGGTLRFELENLRQKLSAREVSPQTS